jgi:hypothetical protein
MKGIRNLFTDELLSLSNANVSDRFVGFVNQGVSMREGAALSPR